MSGTSDEREAFMRGYLAAYEQYQEVYRTYVMKQLLLTLIKDLGDFLVTLR